MHVDDTEIQANLRYDQVMSVLGQTDFNSYGGKNESSFIDILSLNYLYIIQVELLRSTKKYGSIFHQKHL